MSSSWESRLVVVAVLESAVEAYMYFVCWFLVLVSMAFGIRTLTIEDRLRGSLGNVGTAGMLRCMK